MPNDAYNVYLGSLLASFELDDVDVRYGTVSYWSPATTHPSEEVVQMILSDGGGLQVDNLVSFVQRKVSNIVLFCDTSVPLQTSKQWNPADDELSQSHIDFDIPSFFGVIPTDITDLERRSYELSQSHIFRTSEWVPLAQQLQAAQEKGQGIMASVQHVTVDNEYFGIEAGYMVNVTWMYLGRVRGWENQLSPEMKNLVLPINNSDDLGHNREDGPFKDFPNYATTAAEMNPQRANLLANLVGWTVLQNADAFLRILS